MSNLKIKTMTRIKITREGEFTGHWFNPDAAILFIKENTRWNGSNHISKATGEQFEHEALYYTKSGKFILNHYSDWQGTNETYEWLDEGEAVNWIIKNEFKDLEFLNDLPVSVKASVTKTIEDLEI